MLNYLSNLIKLSFCKKIIVISNTFQMLCLFEFIHAHKSIHKEFGNFIIICPYVNDVAFQKIKDCHRELTTTKNLIINYQKKIEIRLLYMIFHFKKLLNLEIEQIIIGNYYSYLNRKFAKISRATFVLDDGTNILIQKNRKLLKKSKYSFFSCFNKRIFSRKNDYKKNNFKFLKNKFIHKKKYSEDVLILGKPAVEGDIFKEHEYDFLIEYVKNKYNNKNLSYFPHPKEKLDILKKKFRTIRFIKSKYPVELYYLKAKKFPKTIVSFNTSAVILLKLFDKKLDIFNIHLDVKLDKNHYWEPYLAAEKEIVDYFKSQLSIKSKTLKIVD